MKVTTNNLEEMRHYRRDTRATLIAQRLAAGCSARKAWNSAIEHYLWPLIRALDRRLIAFCWPIKGEVDLRRMIVDIQTRQGWRTALPVVLERSAPMVFRPWTPSTDMEAGIWGIPIPKTNEIVWPDLVLVPLVGFDTANYRLGYGGGYFDRTLGCLSPRPLTIGVGFELSRLDSVHPQPHDVPMDFIVTEAGVQRRQENGYGSDHR